MVMISLDVINGYEPHDDHDHDCGCGCGCERVVNGNSDGDVVRGQEVRVAGVEGGVSKVPEEVAVDAQRLHDVCAGPAL